MSYRDDDSARGARADALITEIAELERARVARADVDRRLEMARRELATLQMSLPEPAPAPPESAPGPLAHAVVFAASAAATFVGYSLLF